MRKSLFILFVTTSFCSCNLSSDKKENTVTINPKDIQISDVRHDSLTADQIDKIKVIQATFEDVYPVSLEETITNFKRDLNPDKEISIWLHMSEAYKKYLKDKDNFKFEAKKEVFKLILSRSMMPNDEAIINAKLTILTEKDAKEILSFYDSAQSKK